MNRAVVVLVLAVASCDKKLASGSAPAATPAADAACTAKVQAFEPWFAKLKVETRSFELDFGYKLQVIDREPMPVSSHIDAVEIRKAGIAVFDVSEHDHANNGLGDHPTDKAIADRLVTIRAMKAGPDEFEPAPDDLLRIDVDPEATWGDVVHVIDAATKAGYARALIPFTATTKLAQPPGVEPTTNTIQAATAASDKLDALGKQCKAYERAVMHMPARDLSPADDAARYAKQVAGALIECNCSPDPDELRKLMWMDAHWHQARPRVGVTLPLDAAAATTIALPAKTPWSEAHAQLLAATGPVKLAAK